MHKWLFEIKHLARKRIVGNHLKLVVAVLLRYITNLLLVEVFTLLGERLFPEKVISFLNIEFNVAGTVFGILGLLFYIPIDLAVVSMFRSFAIRPDTASVRFTVIFEWFGDSNKILLSLRYACWRLFFGVVEVLMMSIPLSVILAEYNKALSDVIERGGDTLQGVTVDYSLMNTNLILFSLAVLVLFVFIKMIFAAVPYCYLESGSLHKAFTKALHIMIRHLGAYIVFIFGFLGWFLLIFVTMGLAAFFVIPYFGVSKAVFIERIAGMIPEEMFKKEWSSSEDESERWDDTY